MTGLASPVPLLEESIGAAVEPTSAALAALSRLCGDELVERDLERVYAECLRALLRRPKGRAGNGLRGTVNLGPFPEGEPGPQWPGMHKIDVVASRPITGMTAYIELKWGRGTLYNCVWDLCKLGVAVRKGLCSSGYLLAGAPLAEWAAGTRGAEFFSGHEWSTAELCRPPYDRHWRKWCADVPNAIPKMLTARVRSITRGSWPTLVKGADWEIRLAKIVAPGDEWFVFECPEEA